MIKGRIVNETALQAQPEIQVKNNFKSMKTNDMHTHQHT
jgi:hypothetical protein